MNAERTIDRHVAPERTTVAVPPVPLGPPGPMPRTTSGSAWRRLLVPAGVLGSVVAAFAYVGSVNPNEPGHYPLCPLLHFTGIFCPGCGGLRSAHAFIHGDFATALDANALAVIGYVLFAVGWPVWAVRSARGKPWRLPLSTAHLWAIGAVVLVFSVVRNLPFGGWLRP